VCDRRTDGHICHLFVTLQKGESALYMAVDSGHVGVVAVLLDFMYSLDNKVRREFASLRAE